MKRLFFSALLAIVAIGGSLTSKAGAVYFDADSKEIDCTGTGALCRTAIGPQTLWSQPDQQGAVFQSTSLDNSNKLK
ncbi:hypothetical protein [Pedobacter sp. MC2016-24]|uniref:hypothetical protein n=1 Tax=Pedobacter sp. MC2016-24 TaxID=2780090 RepID=UPI001880DCF9|nr:hypothetical protein [Pedobacter sp. MC2016-24]MBE9601864.1 hypothetical protein [Pedobacter sp. MC2016-24]